MFSGSSALAGQRSSKPNSRCIIYYFQWFFSRDKTIYNPLWLWTIYNPLCWNTKTLGKLDKKLSNFSNPFFFLFKKVAVKNFKQLSGKHQCQNLFLNKDRLKLHAATIFHSLRGWICSLYIIQKQPFTVFLQNKLFLKKILNIHRETPVLEIFFNKVSNLKARNFIKKRFSCEYLETFKNSFFVEHLRWMLLISHCEHLLLSNMF